MILSDQELQRRAKVDRLDTKFEYLVTYMLS